ncbi:Uncharacterised protein [Mycobacterium tuberculosis]|nr:Uncharacterised protein [Mycobacterium tuberculosis]CFE46368.1 Uncharacterised protein [Mycobacterium tuberculosis]CFS03359.1 Uncharacterised protein [Mycobacterium tuberculosis]CKP71965.1 Uncharacterised protein [Mycobacterium tuberculosis]CKR13979.1 Uncharacterised protein [Mycobacterium tuberculosis]
MIPFIPGIDAESPISRYPAGCSSGTSNRDEPISDMTAMVAPGLTVRAHDEAGPAGSCNTTSTAKRPAAGSASEIV